MEKLTNIGPGDLSLPALPLHWLNANIENRYAILIIVLLCTLGYLGLPRKQRYATAIPIIGIDNDQDLAAARLRFISDAQTMLLDGYAKHKGVPFYVPSPSGERLMIPPRYVEELKKAPVNEVDFMGGFFEMFEHNFTGIGSRSTLHPRTAKQQLNQHMDEVLDPIEEEIRLTFEEKIPSCEDYVEVPIADIILECVARASNRMFGGEALSKNREWVKTTIDYANAGFMSALKIKKYPYYIRYLVAPFIPEIQMIKKHHKLAREVIVPILRQREADGVKPPDFLQWMADGANGSEKNKDFIAEIQLKITLAALHTSAAPPMQLVYDLCYRPQFIQPLREEIEGVIKEHGKLTKQALMKMYKLDSFMKESQRHNPLLLCTFERIVHKDYQLSDGFTIPSGTTIGVPAQAIAMDASIFPNPLEFDAFRFDKIRQTTTDPMVKGRLQWAASNLENMAFGYGRHACPGRFFAGNEIKLIMINLLMNYDFKFEETRKERPSSMAFETQLVPDHNVKVLVRKRKIE